MILAFINLVVKCALLLLLGAFPNMCNKFDMYYGLLPIYVARQFATSYTSLNMLIMMAMYLVYDFHKAYILSNIIHVPQ